jgi:hypothetical protein
MSSRFAVAAIILSCFAVPGWSQSPSTAAPAAPSPANPVAKKPAPKAKAKAAAKQAAVATDSGPCQIGVIPAIGDKFILEHIGLTVFGNEFTDAPIESWGLDDLVVARARAAAPGVSIKRITYARGAFDPFYHPPRELFRDARNDLVNVVRQVTANANCEHYLVVTRFGGQVAGTNQNAEGIGLLTNWASGTLKYATVFAFFKITVFDGRTLARYDDPIGFGDRLAASLSNLVKDENFTLLRDFENPSTPEAVASNVRLRDGTRDILIAKLDKYLPAYLAVVNGSR